ncbi:MAG: serine hydrolase [bacterium]|nr:serine hydrolase [bacterium]
MKENIIYKEVENLEKIFVDAKKDYAFPGGIVAVGNSEKNFIVQAFGYHTYSEVREEHVDDIFDLASLTKVCSTTPAIMKLYDEGKIKLNDKIADYLPKFFGPNDFNTVLKKEITIEHLLYHSSGFPPDNDIYKMRNSSVSERWDSIFNTPLAYYPGVKCMYSDLNMLFLEKIVEKVSEMTLDKYVENNIYRPLGMKCTFYNPSEKYIDYIVPTEFSIYSDKPCRGIVDDENARSLGGIAGHAGLFSTISDLILYARMLLNKGMYKEGRIFSPETVNRFVQRDKSIPGSCRALGWLTAYDPKYVTPKQYRSEDSFILDKSELYEDLNQPSAGIYIDPDAIGHTGFTGSSFWLSLKYDIFVLFLTNRVFPSRNYTPLEVFNYWRQRVNSAVWQNLGFTKKNELFELSKPSYYHKEN